MANEQLLDSLEIIAVNEDKLAELYAVYARLYPEINDFWLHLVSDELQHAQWVRRLADNARDGAFLLSIYEFNTKIFMDFREYIIQRIEEANKKSISLFQALSIARDMEKTMIEQPFFQVICSDNDQVSRLLRTLHESTEKHLQQITVEWVIHRPGHS
jgi:rubrerythrin